MKQIAQEWTDKAEGDYRVAASQWKLEAPVYDAICFHAQQCVEKYLKACLTENDSDFPKTHDLEALARLCFLSLPDLASQIEGLRFLTSFSVEIRYPGTVAEKQDAERCWGIAQRARSLIRSKLQLTTND